MTRMFLSGNEAFAHGVRLSRPAVISAYPITPQTTVVEALSSMVADGILESDFVHVESEHSALSCAMGASATGRSQRRLPRDCSTWRNAFHTRRAEGSP